MACRPAGQQQDIRAALKWYKQSSDDGFSDGTAALREAQGYLKSHEFDASIFQNQRYITELYDGSFSDGRKDNFIYYVFGFVHELGGTNPLFINGQSCFPQINGGTTSALITLLKNALTSHTDQELANDLLGGSSDYSAEFVKYNQQGKRDAIALFNRYGCDGNIPHTVLDNINGYFDPSVRKSRPAAVPSPTPTAGAVAAATLRKPTMFDCTKASMGTDFVICAFPDLLDAEANLEDAYKAARAARGDVVRTEQIAWMKRYGPDCGLPLRGRPSSNRIDDARECVLSAMKKRTAELSEN